MPPGWDSRPWEGETALVRTGRHPDKFKRMLERAREFTARHLCGGRNSYGRSKAEPERLVRKSGLRYTILRPSKKKRSDGCRRRRASQARHRFLIDELAPRRDPMPMTRRSPSVGIEDTAGRADILEL